VTEAPLGRIATIKNLVARAFSLDPALLVGPRRSRILAHPRQIAMTICRELLPEQSLPAIGLAFMRDHTTVMHAVKAVAERRRRDSKIDREYRELLDAAKAALPPLPAAELDHALQAIDLYATRVAEEVRAQITAGALNEPEAFLQRLRSIAPRPIDRMHPNDVRLMKTPPAPRPNLRHTGPLLTAISMRVPTDLRALGHLRTAHQATAAKLRAHHATKHGSAR